MNKITIMMIGAALLGAGPVASQGTQVEQRLPFDLQHRTLRNPAEAAWTAALGGDCRPHCLDSRLDYYTHIELDDKAVVYLFHGAGGAAEMWMAGEEEAALIGDLVRANYAVVLLESTHRPLDQVFLFPDADVWDDASFDHPALPELDAPWVATINADEALVRRVHAMLPFGAAVRTFVAGFSNGAMFANALAYNLKTDPPALGEFYYSAPRQDTGGGLNVRAAALYGNVGVPYYLGNHSGAPLAVPKARDYDTPTIFHYSQNDPLNCPAEVEANADFLLTLPNPVAMERYMTVPLPLTDDRFARVLGLSFVESRFLHAALVDGGYVDTAGHPTSDAGAAPFISALPPGKERGVRDQLQVLRAEHHVSAQHHRNTVAFFDAHL